MIFTDENGKIYEVPNERYAEFEVSGQRASEINEELKQFVSNNSDNNEVSGYMGGPACVGFTPSTKKATKGSLCYSFGSGFKQYDGNKWNKM